MSSVTSVNNYLVFDNNLKIIMTIARGFRRIQILQNFDLYSRKTESARLYCSLNTIWEAFKLSRFIEEELVNSEYSKKIKTVLILQRPNGLFYFY